MSNAATFSEHIRQVFVKARKYAGWILRTFSTSEETPLLTLWKTLVMPRMDCCSQLWCPTKISDIWLSESVQRHYTSKIKGVRHLNYWDRLGLYYLERRRKGISLFIPGKLVLTSCNLSAITTRRHGRKCIISSSNAQSKNVRNPINNSFANKGPSVYNSLPSYLHNMKRVPLNVFKRELDKFLSDNLDKPGIPQYVKFRAACSNSSTDQIPHEK